VGWKSQNELLILGRSDLDYDKDVETRKSVSGTSTFLCGAPIIQLSTKQRIVALTVTEVELIAATSNAQDIMYVRRLLESIDLRVALPMVSEIDNKGAMDLTNSERTRHISQSIPNICCHSLGLPMTFCNNQGFRVLLLHSDLCMIYVAHFCQVYTYHKERWHPEYSEFPR